MLFGTEYLKATYSYVQSVRRFTLDEKDTQKLCLITKFKPGIHLVFPIRRKEDSAMYVCAAALAPAIS